MTVERKLFSALEGTHSFPDHFLPERLLAGVGDVDFFLDGAQETFIRPSFFIRDRIMDLTVVQRRLDLIQIFVEQVLCLLFERDE
jgi:hypothetical protein